MGTFEPDIRGILSACIPDSQTGQGICDYFGIVLIIGNIFPYLLHAFLLEHRSRAFLYNVRHAVKLGGLPSQPHMVQGHPFPLKCHRHHGIPTTGPGKARRFGKGTEFNRALFGPVDFINGSGKIVFLDKSLISGVKQNHRPAIRGIVDPLFQLLFGVDSTCGIIGGTQINEVCLHLFVGHRQKTVFLVGVQIYDLPARHEIGVHIDRIDRIWDQDGIVHIKKIQDIAQVAFSPIADENFVWIQMHAPDRIMAADGSFQKRIPLFRAVSMKGIFMAHLFHCFVEFLHHRAA